jgi:hypothetical protein
VPELNNSFKSKSCRRVPSRTVSQRCGSSTPRLSKKAWSIGETPYPKGEFYLPSILSQEEVARLIDAALTPYHRILVSDTRRAVVREVGEARIPNVSHRAVCLLPLLRTRLSAGEKNLMARRRSVNFEILTNRTALATQISRKSNAPEYQVHSNGTLAGHPSYRQAQITGLNPQLEQPQVQLALCLGPADFENPRVKLTQQEPKMKCIVVWASIYLRADTNPGRQSCV